MGLPMTDFDVTSYRKWLEILECVCKTCHLYLQSGLQYYKGLVGVQAPWSVGHFPFKPSISVNMYTLVYNWGQNNTGQHSTAPSLIEVNLKQAWPNHTTRGGWGGGVSQQTASIVIFTTRLSEGNSMHSPTNRGHSASSELSPQAQHTLVNQSQASLAKAHY